MQALRQIINSDLLSPLFNLPIELRNRRVEVLILPAEDTVEQLIEFEPQQFAGLLKVEDIDSEIKKLRDEWERC